MNIIRYFLILPLIFILIFAFLSTSSAADSIDWTYSYEDALKLAQSEGKPIMAGFYTGWCGYCAKLDKVTYLDSRVIAASKEYVCLKVDLEKRRDLAYTYGIGSVPAFVFMDPLGKVIWRDFGYRDPEVLSGRMREVSEFYNKIRMVEPYIQKAFDEAKNGRIDQAFAIINKGITEYPKDARLYAARSSLYSSQKDLDAALDDLNTSLSLNPSDYAVLTMRGAIYYEKRDLDKALEDVNKSIAINRWSYEAHNGRGIIFLERKDFASAIKSFNATLIINPRHAGAYYSRGIANMQIGLLDRAVADLSKAIEILPGLVSAYLNRATAYMYAGQYENSWRDLHSAQSRGAVINPEFMAELKKRSGREE